MKATVVRRLAALLTAIMGAVNILSALYPTIPERLELLRDILPLDIIRGAQTATVLAGFLLIALADGLRKRRRRAMKVAVVLLLLSVLLNLAKGLDFEEATLSLGLAVILATCRHSFDVRSPVPSPQRLLPAALTFGLLYYAYLFVGFLLFGRFVSPTVTMSGVLLEPFRLLLDHPHYTYVTPQAQWYARSLSCLLGAGAVAAVGHLLRPLVPCQYVSPGEVAACRRVIERFGSDTLSYFALQRGRSYFLAPEDRGVISYRTWGTVALVGGGPIGAADCIPMLLDDFLQFARNSALKPCFVGVRADEVHHYQRRGLRTVKIGEEALIDLPRFDVQQLKRKVRRASRHIEALGVDLALVRRSQVSEAVVRQMEDISREWVRAHGGKERGFSMTLGRLPDEGDADCEIAVASRDGEVLGFLVVVPVPAGNGWSLDAMRRRPASPNGLMEALVIFAAERYRDRGFATLSLNFAALSNCVDDIGSTWVEWTRRLIFTRLSGIYQLRSLYEFNAKFAPRWQSRYLAYPDALSLPHTALAVVQSEDPVRLPTMFRR